MIIQKPVYDPCFYRDINYEHLLDNDSIIEELFHRNTEKDQIKTCTSWQFNTSEFGDTITSEVITIIFLSISYKKTKVIFNYVKLWGFTVELGLRQKTIKKLCRDDVFDGRSVWRFFLRSRV